jgi:diguanylate cyclase (GGDEF)-like protein/PAS domain S-box-containing protein
MLDSAPSEALDGLVQLAALAVDAPVSAISLVDADRQWFMAACGLSDRQGPREHAFCAHTVEHRSWFEIADTRLDARFMDNPAVTGELGVRFYAGAPLLSDEGHCYGALCVVDKRPRQLDARQRAAIEGLARQVVLQLEQLRERREAQFREAVLRQTLESIPDGVVTCDAAGMLAEFNATARDWHGVDPRALPPEQWADHFDLYDTEGTTLLATEAIPLLRAFGGETVHEQEIVIRAKGQPSRTVLCNARQLVAPDGRAGGAVCVMYDVTAQREAQRALAAERARLASVIDASRDVSIIATTADGTITLFNSGAERLLGYAADELVGRESPVVFHLASEVESRALEMSAALGAPVEGFDVFVRASRDGRVETREWTYVRKDGAHRRVRLSVSTLLGDNGAITGFLGMGIDLTEQLRAQDAERLAAERLAEAFNGAAHGMALADLDGRFSAVNDALCRMLGYERDALHGLTFDQLAHPEDVQAGLAQRQRVLAGDGTSFHVRKRCLHRDGHVVWTELSMSLVRDAQGAPLHFVAQIQDISRERAAEIERDRTEQRLRTITDNAPALIAYLDPGERFRFVNAAFCDWYDVQPDELLGRTIEQFRGADARARVAAMIGRALDGERVVIESEIPHARLGLRTCQITFIPDVADSGSVRGFHVMAYDVTAQKTLARVMEERALTDELTGLPNRAALKGELERATARAARANQSVAALFIDLDRFKVINDEHGHAAGDAVLRTFAKQLTSVMRAGEFCARLAGDEFVVLLRDTGDVHAHAERLAARLHAANRAGAQHDGLTLPIHASVGIAVQAPGCLNANALLQAADAAMYAAKRSAT